MIKSKKLKQILEIKAIKSETYSSLRYGSFTSDGGSTPSRSWPTRNLQYIRGPKNTINFATLIVIILQFEFNQGIHTWFGHGTRCRGRNSCRRGCCCTDPYVELRKLEYFYMGRSNSSPFCWVAQQFHEGLALPHPPHYKQNLKSFPS